MQVSQNLTDAAMSLSPLPRATFAGISRHVYDELVTVVTNLREGLILRKERTAQSFRYASHLRLRRQELTHWLNNSPQFSRIARSVCAGTSLDFPRRKCRSAITHGSRCTFPHEMHKDVQA